MDENKRPHGFRLEPDLQNIQPYDLGAESYSENKKKDLGAESYSENKKKESFVEIRTIGRGKKFNERSNNGVKGGRNFRKDGASIFDRITPMKKSLDVRNAKSFFESEYEAGLQNHPDEVEEEEVHERSHHGWKNEEGGDHFDRYKFSSERSVRMEQKRIVITRNLDGEDESFSRRSPEFNSVYSPQVRIRTLKNNQRRVRMNH